MPPKLQLDKEAWKWADTTEPDQVTNEHIKTAYRLNLKPCSQGACKRNCRGNPLCLNGIGEKQWLGELNVRKFTDFDPELEKREKDSYVGLKNLGNTCYVNTFLQLWYHNHCVRQAIFRWRDADLPDIISDSWTPSTICGQLQLIFSLLKYTQKRYIDPSSFINHLGLDTALQQDAQEFSKLFLSLLEEAMSKSSQLNIIQDQFRGQYNYVITCAKCKGESKTGSTFYELDLNIQGHRTLHQAIDNFLQEEVLEGENQYMCKYCLQKQDATRAIKLDTIPPVLNLQLLRFVFDKKTGHKKKLNSFIQFPECLDMSKYLGQPENTSLYYLKAVLIHSGPSAYSGHYTAHILSEDGSAWYRFNDEKTDKMMGKKLQLGAEEDIQELPGKEQKAPKVTKGCHTSKNAYMLVYSRQQQNKTEEVIENINEYNLLPPVVKDYVAKDNENFNKWIAEILSSRKQNIENGKAEQTEVQSIYRTLSTDLNNIDEMEWISVDWLIKWLNLPSKAPAIDNTSLLCPHKQLDPESVHKMKCVSSIGANSLYTLYGGGPRLKRDKGLCRQCVKQRCHVIRLKIKMASDDQKITTGLKNINNSGLSWYWVGKSSLRSWKKLALDRLENGSNRSSSSPSHDEQSEQINGSRETEDPAESSFIFNTDLLCDLHDNLNPDATCRRLVPEDVWKILYSYFPYSQQFRIDDAICQQCQALNAEKCELKLQKKRCVDQQKSDLLDLYLDRKRPVLDDLSNLELYVVSQAFVDDWRKYIKDSGRSPAVTNVNNKLLLCEHNLLILSPEQLDYHSEIVLLWSGEWEKLCKYTNCDVDINIVRYKEESGEIQTLTIPVVCKECQSMRLLEEEKKRYIFVNSVVYVYKNHNNTTLPVNNGTNNTHIQTNEVEEPPDKIQKIDFDFDFSRRKSQRRRKLRGEKEVTVSSDMTLKDLKVKIMNLFSVPPFDQNLWIDGRLLLDNASTLQELKVYPACSILLKVDEPNEESTVIEDLMSAPPRQEQGFKGTNLLSSC
ncbi:hypothetical protein SNE40_015165 [Patella caerulea]|uniref:Ubiquitin carboxyl-terminal hydrolase 48 n=1 Tax=Patella caerulea TaxID=87958 RepID=A0AAN8PE91_PATCE